MRSKLADISPQRITTSPLSAGPPLGPSDGDIWIATAVDAGTRWQFQYSASSTSAFKWEFIGGARQQVVLSGISTSSATFVADATGITIARAGEYLVGATGRVFSPVDSTLWQPGVRTHAGNEAIIGEHRNTGSGSTDYRAGASGIARFSASAGDIATAVLRNGSADGNTGSFSFSYLTVEPIRIS